MKYTVRQAFCARFLTLFYTALCVFGCIGCVVTGFSVPVYSHVLYPGLFFICLFVLLLDIRPERTPRLRFLYYVLLLGASALYTGLRIDTVILGLCYIAVYIFRWLCFGYSGLSMPAMLEDTERRLLAAVGTPAEAMAVVSIMTEALLYVGWIVGCSYIILRGCSVKLSALLPLPFFVVCFLVISATVPDPWALTFLLLFWILTLFTGASQKYNPIAAAMQTAVLTVPVLLLFSFVMGVFPKENTVRIRLQSAYDRVLVTLTDIGETLFDGGSGEGPFSVSVEGNEIDFSSLGRRRYSGRTVMHAESDTSGIYYLRENTYNTYTETGWTYTAADVGAFSQSGLGEDIHTVSSRILMQNGADTVKLTLTGANAAHLFTPYYFHEAETDGVYTGNGDRNLKNTRRDASYPMTLYQFSGVFADLREDAVMTGALRDVLLNYIAANRSLYTQINGSTATALRQILREEGIPTGKPAEEELWERIAEITLFVRGSADYSLDAPLPPTGGGGGTDFVTWFLTEADVGYCTYFATAEVMLLRAVGIPARLAVGYLVNITDAGQQTPVRDSSAHAWAEVFDARLGWIPIEATPPTVGEDTGAGEEDTAAPQPDGNTPPTEEKTETVTETDVSTDTDAPEHTTDTPGSPGTDPGGSGTSGNGTGSAASVSAPGGTYAPALRAGLYLCLALTGVGLLVWGAGQYRAYRLRLLKKRTGGPRPGRVSSVMPPENEYALFLCRRCYAIAAMLGQEFPETMRSLAERAQFSQHVMTNTETALLRDTHDAYTEQLREADLASGDPLRRFIHQWIDVYY